MHLLFLCSRNKWRSRTAETIFKNNGHHVVRSAGTARTARVRLTQSLVDWADVIYTMEHKHRRYVLQNFNVPPNKNIQVLEIPDEYTYLDEELVDILRIQLRDVFE